MSSFACLFITNPCCIIYINVFNIIILYCFALRKINRWYAISINGFGVYEFFLFEVLLAGIAFW